MVPEFILNLPTPRLLKYFKKHYRDRKGYIQYHYTNSEDNGDQEYLEEFMESYNAIKAELDRREHVA